MTVEEAIEYFIKCNENIISVAKDENVYNFEKQQIEAICSRRAFEANELALKALGLTKSGLLKDCESCRAELPCTDAISRKYIQEKYATCADMLHPDADIVMEWVDEAPPVRVTEKSRTMGSWNLQ